MHWQYTKRTNRARLGSVRLQPCNHLVRPVMIRTVPATRRSIRQCRAKIYSITAKLSPIVKAQRRVHAQLVR
jgi:hypothetical protein